MPVPALLKTAWEFPPTRAAMIRGGAAIAGGIAGKLIGSPETEQYRKQLKEQMDLLQKQMAGLPTPASKAVQQTIRQQSRQAQQSLAASAQGAGQTGTSVSRAIQARELGRQAEQQATAKGQLSIAAQQQYTQLLGAQEAMARVERGHISGILNYIMQGVGDAEIRELLMEVLRGNQRSTFAPGEAGSAQDLAGKPPSSGEAGSAQDLGGRLPSSGDVVSQAPSGQQAPPFQQQLGPPAPRSISLHEASIPTEPTTLTQYTGQPAPTVTPEYVSTGTVPTAPRYERPGLEQFPRTATDVTPTTFEPREALGAQPPMQGPQPALGPPPASPRELATPQIDAEVIPGVPYGGGYPTDLLDALKGMERLLEGDMAQRGFYDYRWNELRRRYNMTEQEMRNARHRALYPIPIPVPTLR